MRQQPYLLPHFPRTVRFPVMQIPRQSDIGRLAGHSSGAARNGDVGPRHIHAWTDDISFGDCVAQRDIVQCPVGSHIPNSREPGVQRCPRIRHRLQHDLRRRLLEHVERVPVLQPFAVRQVRVAVDETRQHCLVG